MAENETLTVTGEATRIFYNGKGVEVSVSYKTKEGSTKTRKYTAWFNTAPNINLNDTVTVAGRLTATIKAWTNVDGTPKLDNTGKPGQSIEIAINDAKLASAVSDEPF
jgi:hypothetical protein